MSTDRYRLSSDPGPSGNPLVPAGRLKLFVIADDDRFFQSEFLDEFLGSTTDLVVGSAIVTRIPAKNSLEAYLRKNWFRLRPKEVVLLGWKKYSRAFYSQSILKARTQTAQTVRNVFSRHRIPSFDVVDDLNQSNYLRSIRALAPDVIVASCSLIFGQKLLNTPRLCCINRHSSLLPDYRGVWPVFQAYRSGERQIGSTIHVMDSKIDCGQILARERFFVTPNATLHQLYRRCFEISAPLLLRALDRIRHDELNPEDQPTGGRYYSFPTGRHWREFRARGGRLI